MTYNPNIPQSGDKQDQSQPQILTNFTQANTVFGNEHVPFDDGTAANRGKHTAARFVEQSSDPSTAANEMAFYTKAVSSVSQFFFRDESSGTIRQVTGLIPSTSVSGSRTILLPSGLRLNFGSVTIGSVGGTAITFHTPFTSDVFFVVATQRGGKSEAISVTNITVNGFTGRSFSSSLPTYYFSMGI